MAIDYTYPLMAIDDDNIFELKVFPLVDVREMGMNSAASILQTEVGGFTIDPEYGTEHPQYDGVPAAIARNVYFSTLTSYMEGDTSWELVVNDPLDDFNFENNLLIF